MDSNNTTDAGLKALATENSSGNNEAKRRSLLPQRRTQQASGELGPVVPSNDGPAPARAKPTANTSTSRLARSTSLRQPNAALHTASSTSTTSGGPGRSQIRHAPNTSHPRPRSVFGLEQLSEIRGQPAESDPALQAAVPITRALLNSSSVGGLKRSASNAMRGARGAYTTTSKADIGSKPQFSTFQQHFSPKKAVPAPATPLAEDVSQALPPGLLTLQNELLQLSLLHWRCHSSMRAWEGEAKRKLRSTFEAVKAREEDVGKLEDEVRRKECLKDLRTFSNVFGDGGGREEALKSLADATKIVDDFSDPNSRFSSCVSRFESWFETASSHEDAGLEHRVDYVGVVGSMKTQWMEDAEYCTRKLELCARGLENFGKVGDGKSGLDKVVLGHKMLVESYMEELQTMKAVNAATVKRERQKVKTRIDSILSLGSHTSTKSEREDQTPIRQGAWTA